MLLLQRFPIPQLVIAHQLLQLLLPLPCLLRLPAGQL
jgi:hypothetical protein